MREKCKHKGGDSGSVLMETVLVIPLYIAFFSGILLLGELCLGRNRLTAADRFGVWLAGNRHVEKEADAVKSETSGTFFPTDEFAAGTKLESLRINQKKVDWYALVQGSGTLKMVLPDWVTGARKGALLLFADIGDAPERELWDDVSFRARDVESVNTHSVLMRRRYDVRDKPGRELASNGPLWYLEYRTPYLDRDGKPVDRPGGISGACDTPEYVRSGWYNMWSQ